MRDLLVVLLLAALGVSGILGSSAFNLAHVTGRSISATVTGDAAAYLSLQANSASPHDCFVTEDPATGKLSITFGATNGDCGVNGGGTGVNAADGTAGKFTRYAFHDILKVTNKGGKDVLLWVNTTTTSGSGSLVEAAKRASPNGMSDADYYSGDQASTLSLARGSSAYVGVAVKTGTLSTGEVTGALRFSARGT